MTDRGVKEEPSSGTQLMVYVDCEDIVGDRDPGVVMDERLTPGPDTVQFALETSQDMVEVSPERTRVGFAEMVTIGGGGVVTEQF